MTVVPMKRFLKTIAQAIGLLLAGLAGLVLVSTYHPRDLEMLPVVCSGFDAPLKPGQRLKVLSWNVQYMAGKNHVFFYDLPGGDGPDERPASPEISLTMLEVVRVIRDEDPDVVLLQELDHGSRRTDYRDELCELLALLPPDYSCHTSAFYHKAWFVPHPRIMGAAGMKLAVISKYQISRAVRHQLAVMPDDPVTKLFNFKRCMLEAWLTIEGGGEVAVLCTHLDAFAQGNNTMERQVAQVKDMMKALDAEGRPWLIGGDFNLLPPGGAYALLGEGQKVYFNPYTEIEPLFNAYRSVPSLLEANGGQRQSWFTHFPNDPAVKGPDRIIDYLFFSDQIALGKHYVRQHDCMKVSDHFPLVVEVKLPEAGQALPKGRSEVVSSRLLQ